ncbi:MAG: hypothetical protein ABIP30_03650 [Ferruginibacter sp.]
MSSQNQIPAKGSNFISLQQAIDLTSTFRKNKDNILAEKYKGTAVIANSETFNRDGFDALLSNPECAAVRMYTGMDANMNLHAVFVGVNSKNEDLLPMLTSGLPEDGDDPKILDEGQRCPAMCPPPSPLNP